MNISFLRAKLSAHRFDIICIYLESTTVLEYQNLEKEGNNLVKSDHSSNSKRVRVCNLLHIVTALKVTNVLHSNSLHQIAQ